MSITKAGPVDSIWETKQVGNKRHMICQNSNLEKSKWAEFAPEDGPCGEWSIVVNETTAVLCSKCVQRSVNGPSY